MVRQAAIRAFLLLVALAFALSIGVIPASAAKKLWPPNETDFSGFDKRTRAKLKSIYFVGETFEGVKVAVPAPHAKVRDGLKKLVSKKRSSPELFLRLAAAHIKLGEDDAAEKAMLKYISSSRDSQESLKVLSQFYKSRLNPEKQIQAMEKLAKKLNSKSPKDNKDIRLIYINMAEIARRHNFPDDKVYRAYDLMEKALPDDFEAFAPRLEAMVKAGKLEAARKQNDRMWKKFPDKRGYLLKIAANIYLSENDPYNALLLYSDIQPTDSSELYNDYIRILNHSGRLSARKKELQPEADLCIPLSKALPPAGFSRSKTLCPASSWLRKGEFNVREAGELFNLYLDTQYDKANKLLNDWADRDKLSRREIEILGELFMRAGKIAQASKYYYSIYLSSSVPDEKEKSLERLFQALMSYSARPFTGSRLSSYLSSDRFDTGLSSLGGVLSLVLNGTGIDRRFRDLEIAHSSYEARREAKKVLIEMERVFPKSIRLADMKAAFTLSLISYAQYDKAIASARDFIEKHPGHKSYFGIYMLIPKAYAGKNDKKKEWKAYEEVMAAAARRKDSTTYHKALKEYIHSLTASKKFDRVLELYRKEIKKRPNDEGLYEKLLQFAEKHDLYDEERRVYEAAINSFKTSKWYHRFARWYLRKKGQGALEDITNRLKEKMGPPELAKYLNEFVYFQWNDRKKANSRLYLAMHLYAHKRFPNNMTFVKSLMKFYEHFNLRDHGYYKDEQKKLGTEYFLYDKDIRQKYYRFLSRSGQLEGMVERIASNPEATISGRAFIAWGHRWVSEYEAGLEHFEELYKLYPGDIEIASELAGLHRSLSKSLYGTDLEHLQRSAKVYSDLGRLAPTETKYPTLEGEVWIDAGEIKKAQAAWQKLVSIEPGNTLKYLELAAIYWDYYLLDDSRNALKQARVVSGNPILYADKLAAVLESAGRRDEAIKEYINASVKDRYGTGNLRKRLAYLAKSRNKKNLILRLYSAEVEKAPNPGAVMSYSDLLYTMKEKDLRIKLLTDKINTQTNLNFIVEASEIFSSYGRIDLEEKALSRLAGLYPSDMQYMERLTSFYERTKQYDKARSTYEKIVNILIKDKENSEAINMLVKWSMFEARIDNKALSMEIYGRAAHTSKGPRTESLKFGLAQKYLEHEKFDKAKSALAGLIKDHPLKPEYFNLLARVLTKTDDLNGLIKLYKDALKSFRSAPMARALKREKLKSLRLGLADSYTRLKMYTEAQDNLIEAINLDPVDEYTVRKAYSFSKEHNLAKRLIAYYEKTAKKSFKNHRWQIVLSVFHMEERNLDAAAGAFKKAIEIEPQRLDFYERLADVHLLRGDYPAARAVYEELARLDVHKKRWWDKVADMYARAGQYDLALKQAKSIIEKGPADFQPYFRLANILDRWGKSQDAVTYLDQGIAKFQDDLYLRNISYFDIKIYSGVMARAGKSEHALHEMLKLRSLVKKTMDKNIKNKKLNNNILKSSLYVLNKGIEIHLPQAAFKHETPSNISKLTSAVSGFIKNIRPGNEMEPVYIGFARNIKSPQLEQEILSRLERASSGSNKNPYYGKHSSYLTNLERFLGERRMFDDLAKLMARFNHPTTYFKLATVGRVKGDEQIELNALKKWYKASANSGPGMVFTTSLEPAQEYYRLLEEMKLDDEIEKLTHDRSSHSGYFLAHLVWNGELDLALKTLDRAYADKHNAWKDSMRAIILEALDARPKEVLTLFKKVLWEVPVGSKLGRQPDSNEVFSSDMWDKLAFHTGKFLLKQGDEEGAVDYLAAHIEKRPRSTSHYKHAAKVLLDAGKPDIAREFYQRALKISDKDSAALAWLAASTWMSGDKDEARQLWDKLLARDSNDKSYLYLATASYAGAFKEAEKKIRTIATDQYLEGHGHIELLDAIREFYIGMGKDGIPVSFLKELVKKKPGDVHLAEYIVDASWVPLEDIPFFYEIVISRLSSMKSPNHEHLNEQKIQYLEVLIKLKDIKKAMNFIDGLVTSEVFSKKNRYDWRSKALFEAGKTEDAAQELRKYIETWNYSRGAYEHVQKTLNAKGHKEYADAFKKQMLEKALKDKNASGRDMIALARLLIKDREQHQRALELLKKATLLRPDDISSLKEAASVFEEMEEWAVALKKREMVAAITPLDCSNRVPMMLDIVNMRKRKGEPSTLPRGETAEEKGLAGLKAMLASSECSTKDMERLPEVYANIVSGNKLIRKSEISFLMERTAGRTVAREEYFLTLAKLLKPKEAIAVLENYASRGHYPAKSLLGIAKLSEKLGDDKRKISALERSLVLTPADYALKARLARAYYDNGQYRRAVDVARIDKGRYRFTINITPDSYYDLTQMNAELRKIMPERSDRFEYVRMIADAALKADEPVAALKYAGSLKNISSNRKELKEAEKLAGKLQKIIDKRMKGPGLRAKTLASAWQ